LEGGMGGEGLLEGSLKIECRLEGRVGISIGDEPRAGRGEENADGEGEAGLGGEMELRGEGASMKAWIEKVGEVGQQIAAA
jgi:hypothetical protein